MSVPLFLFRYGLPSRRPVSGVWGGSFLPYRPADLRLFCDFFTFRTEVSYPVRLPLTDLHDQKSNKKMNKFSTMLKKCDVYVRIELRNKILTTKTTTSGVYPLNLFIYLMILYTKLRLVN